VKLTLGWSRSDRENLLRTVSAFGEEIAGSGLGSFHRWLEFSGETRPVTHGVHHPMGGTRMHADPKVGVVDESCRVHGVSNLYVAGSSVFTTGLGYANPTLTLLALSVRLADHIASVLGRTSPLDAHV
jgi:choline dehydrogenase-like flavoprotein